MPPDTLKTLLDWATAQLRQIDIETPLLDARLLLAHATSLTREDMILDPQRSADPVSVEKFRDFIARRMAHEPVSRILGTREFYGRAFTVTPAVLDPRPDTETLIDLALPLIAGRCRILDLGTGSGAIIVTLLAERPAALGVAVDTSEAALKTAKANAEAHGVAGRLSFLTCSWFERVSGRFDLIAANPPYIPAGDIQGLEPDVREFDPHLALAGGTDGLDAYRQIAAGAGHVLAPGGQIVVEIGAGQALDVEEIFARAGFSLRGEGIDLGGHIRCLAFAGSPNL
jgi:release factor glutamine methyltransferase